VELHVPIREDLAQVRTPVQVYFGVELNYTGCDQDFAYSQEIMEQSRFQFAIGGIHSTYVDEYDLAKIMDIQHRHHLATCANPLVQVLVHPYWFGTGEFTRNQWPWFDTVKAVPAAYVRELGQTARDTHTAIEINAGANLTNPANPPAYVDEYLDYLAALAAEGASFSVGSDAHGIDRLADINAAWTALERLNLPAEQIWHPAMDPAFGGNG
jgi:histidinol phosphatase-like PHP family hydrolase